MNIPHGPYNSAPIEGDLQSPPAHTLRAGGASSAKLSSPPVAVDTTMRQDNGLDLREIHVRLERELVRQMRVAAAYDELTLSAWLSEQLPSLLKRYPK